MSTGKVIFNFDAHSKMMNKQMKLEYYTCDNSIIFYQRDFLDKPLSYIQASDWFSEIVEMSPMFFKINFTRKNSDFTKFILNILKRLDEATSITRMIIQAFLVNDFVKTSLNYSQRAKSMFPESLHIF